MGMDKYGRFMQMCVYYYWKHSQHRAWRLDMFQRSYMFFKDLFMSIRLMKKEIQGSHYFSFFALINLLTNLFTFLQDSAAHFFWTCKMYIAYIVYYYICLPLCAHILYFDAAKFSIKLFSFFVYIWLFLLSVGMGIVKVLMVLLLLSILLIDPVL